MKAAVGSKHVPADFLFRIYRHQKTIAYQSGGESVPRRGGTPTDTRAATAIKIFFITALR